MRGERAQRARIGEELGEEVLRALERDAAQLGARRLPTRIHSRPTPDHSEQSSNTSQKARTIASVSPGSSWCTVSQ
jgi:hypothetical protein